MSLLEPAGGLDGARRPETAQEREPAHKAFYADHKDRVFRIINQLTGDADLAEEATNEALFQLFTHWYDVNELKRSAWVITTALNYTKSWRRRWSRWRKHEARYGEARVAPVPPDPFSHVLAAEATAALRRLPRRQREVMVLRYQADCTPHEIAEILGIDPSTVGVHEHRALKTLRKALDGQEETR